MTVKAMIRALLLNRISVVLVVAHFFLILCLYWERRDRLNLPFHFHYESTLFKILFQLDLPALWVTGWIIYAIHEGFSPADESIWMGIVSLVIMIACTSLQWAIIGFLAGKVWGLYTTSNNDMA